MNKEKAFTMTILKILSFKIIEYRETEEKLAVMFVDTYRRIANLTYFRKNKLVSSLRNTSP